jgi:RHS repeat-associated protein
MKKLILFFIAFFCVSGAIFAQSISKVNGSYCVNSEAFFIVNGSCSTYSWSIANGTNNVHYQIISGSTSSSFQVKWLQPQTNNSVNCSCNGSSVTPLTFTTLAAVTPAVSLALNTTSICQGSNIGLTATPTNGGTPIYNWYIDGVNVASGSSASFNYATTSLTPGSHTAYVQMTSNATCVSPNLATSTSKSFTVTAKSTYTVSLSGPESPICSTTTDATFVAIVNNGVPTLSYKWFANGVEVTGATTNIYTRSVVNGMQVYCVVSSNGSCVNTPVQSSTYTMQITSPIAPNVGTTIPKLSFCTGEYITFSASSPYITTSSTYSWRLNGVEFSTTSSTWLPASMDGAAPYSFSPGDAVTVVVNGLSGNCLSSTSATGTTPTLTVNHNVVPDIVASADDTEICQGTNVQLQSRSNFPGQNPSYVLYVDANPVQTNATGNFTLTGLAPGEHSVYVRLTSNAMCAAPPAVNSNPLAIIVNRPPVVDAGPDRVVALPTNSLTMSSIAFDPEEKPMTYSWVKMTGGAATLTNATTQTVTISGLAAGNYVFNASASDECGSTSDGVNISVIYPDNNVNYIRDETVAISAVTDPATIPGLAIGSKVETTNYFDGLGRAMQTVNRQASPTFQDIVAPVVYDVFGRNHRNYLPFSAENNGWAKLTQTIISPAGPYLGIAQPFYSNGSNNKVADDPSPFSETLFEPSPLNRPISTTGPGDSWRTNNKSSQQQFRINIHGTGAGQEKIIAWKVDVSTGMPLRQGVMAGVVTGGYHASGVLQISVSIDEEGNETRQYTDEEGRMLLKKVKAVTTPADLNNVDHWALTYYIYDDLQNLRYVLPPEVSRIVHQNDTYVPTATELNNWAFQYRYDGRKRIREKRVPGADWVYMVYDNLDRLVLTQDGKQRAGATSAIKYWTFTKYDRLNRPILTGIKDTTTTTQLTQAQMQAVVDQWYAERHSTKPHRQYWESYVGVSAGNNVHGYSNLSYPTVTAGPAADLTRYVTVTYYDNYNFITDWAGAYSYVSHGLSGSFAGESHSQAASANLNVTGQVTGSKVKVLDGGIAGGSTWLKAISYYDEKYRVIQTVSDNLKGGEDRTSTLYSFAGSVIKTKTTHVERDVTWKDLVNAQQIGNILKRTGTAKGGAASAQVLPASTNGWMEFIYSPESTTRFVGFNDANPDVSETNINYAFKLVNTAVTVVENNGTAKATLTGLRAGDVLRIERVGTAMKFYKNGVEITLSPAATASSSALMVDVTLTSTSATIPGVRTSFSETSKESGRRFVYDHVGRLAEVYHALGTANPVTWGAQVGVSVTNGILTKTGTTTGWNAGAFSTESIAAGSDGWIEFPAYEINKSKMIGLADTNPNITYTNIDYALYLNGTGILVYENGANIGNFGNFVASDVLRIERRSGVIYYFKNGLLLHTSTVPSSTVLYADCSLHALGGSISGLTMSGNGNVNTSELRLVKNEYNEIGQLVDKKLHTPSGSTAFAQSVDFRYNIRGWLTSINNAALTSDANATNDETTDYFGMSLNYNVNDSDLANTTLFNGNISGVKWSNYPGTGTIKQKGYIYTYDPMNRLTGSTFREKTTAWASLTGSKNAETGFTYDLNGNIKALTRNDKRGSGTMDILAYGYGSGSTLSNRLLTVTDTGDKKTGFIDGTNTGNDYAYDANGNMTVDNNKGIASITYNFLNLPEVVTKGGNTIQYVYDASGRKLSQVTSFAGQQKLSDYAGEFSYVDDQLQSVLHEEGRIVLMAPTTVSSHTGENTSDVTGSGVNMALFVDNGREKYVTATSTGTVANSGITAIGMPVTTVAGERYRIRVKGYRTKGTSTISNAAYILLKLNGTNLAWPGAALPLDQIAESWVEQVVTIPTGGGALTVGAAWSTTVSTGEVIYLNEMQVIKEAVQTPEYQYNMKDHLGNVRLTFTTKDEVVKYTATLENNTQTQEQSTFTNYSRVTNDLFDHTDALAVYDKAQLLHGGNNSQVGLTKSLSVMPGDVIQVDVFAKYINATGGSGNVSGFASALLGAFGVAPPAVGEVGTAAAALNSYGSFIAGGGNPGNSANPKGWLNVLVFDKDYNLVDLAYQQLDAAYSQDIGSAIKAAHMPMTRTVTIKEAGYVYIYLSNEGAVQQDIYFDDLTITHTKGKIVQTDDYYAFGFTFNSYRRENGLSNMYQYNGKEKQDELDLGWMDYGARMYMPEIGRWGVVDPLAEISRRWSPYTYVMNNPIRFIDPDGMAVEDCEGCKKSVTSQQVLQDIKFSPNYDKHGRLVSLNATLTLSNVTVTEYINNDEKSENYGKVMESKIEAITSEETFSMGRYKGSGTVNKADGDLMARISDIDIPGGQPATKVTAHSAGGKGSIHVESVTTNKTDLNRNSLSTLRNARDQYLDKTMPGPAGKYGDFIISRDKQNNSRLNAVSGDHQGRVDEVEAEAHRRSHRFDSLKRLHLGH